MALRKKLGKAKPAGNPFRQFRVPELPVRRNPRLDAGAAAAAVADLDRRHQPRRQLHRQPALRPAPGRQRHRHRAPGQGRWRRVTVNLPASAAYLLRADETDLLSTRWWRPTPGWSRATGNSLAPLAAKTGEGQGLVSRRRIEGDNVRIAYAFIPVREGQPPAVVQVAETLKKREALSGSIISGVLLPQFAIIPLAVILVYMGLSARHRPAAPAAGAHPPPPPHRPVADTGDAGAGRGASAGGGLQPDDGAPGRKPAGAAALHRPGRAPDAHAADRAQDPDRNRTVGNRPGTDAPCTAS
jgi:hypothetical protein